MDAANLPFYVIGHLNPDTDAICSAIGHAELLRRTGEPTAQAVRCGAVPQRTAWVLERAGIAEPPLVTDVRANVGMICQRDVVRAQPSDTFFEAYRAMLEHDVRSVPVVDGRGRASGILRYRDLLELLLPGDGSERMTRTVHVSLSKVTETLGAESAGAPLPEGCRQEDLIMLVGASSQETVDRRLAEAAAEGDVDKYLVVCGDRPMVHRFAIQRGVRALLVTGGNVVSDELLTTAREKGVVVLHCRQDTASSTTLIRCSRTVDLVMMSDFHTVAASEPVSHLRKSLSSLEQDLFPVIDPLTKVMVGVLSKSDLVDPPRTRVALVDHNEFAQAVRGIEEARIVEVIDHHRLAGDLVSREPIRFLNEPVGSTSTLVARKFEHRDLEPSPGTAMCLSAGIISDTLCLTSPTTTDLDREMLAWLSRLAGIDPEVFKNEFFAIGSLLAEGKVEEILNADRKQFDDDGVRVTIAQVEELGLHALDERKQALMTGLRELVDEEGFDLAVLAVTDIGGHHSVVLAAGLPNLVSQLPFDPISPGIYDAPGVVSRKLQLFPAVCSAIRQLPMS